MAKTWDDFLPLIQPHLPSCQVATIKTYLAQAAQEFFARTYIWQEEIDALYLAPNQIEYDLDSDAVVEDVLAVVYESQKLDRIEARKAPFEEFGRTGRPQMYWLHTDATVRVFPTPETRATLRVHAVLKTARTATSVPDWVYETFADVLVSGAVARLASIPGKDWTDVGMAQLNNQKFEREIANARVRSARGVDMSVRQRPFA